MLITPNKYQNTHGCPIYPFPRLRSRVYVDLDSDADASGPVLAREALTSRTALNRSPLNQIFKEWGGHE